MKKTFLTIMAALMMPVALFADGYTALWKQFGQAQKKDMPKSQIEILDKIATQAEKQKSYGNLLKAETNRFNVLASISNDSVANAVRRFESRAAAAEKTDKALAAVYYCVLSDVYRAVSWNTTEFPDAARQSADYAGKALQDAALLAGEKAEGYAPFVKKGVDSKIFNHDLLSVIGYKLRAFKKLNQYYTKAGNRVAALMTGLEMVEQDERAAGNPYVYGNAKAKGNRYIMRLDSLINVYGDLPECGEVAIERYNVMRECNDVSAAEKAEYIKTALGRWAAWRNIPQLNNRYEELIQPSFRAEVKDMILPERTDSVWLTVRNMREIKVSVTRLKLSGNTDLVANSDKDWAVIRKLLIPSTKIEMKKPVLFANEYDQTSLGIALPKLKPGLYAVEISGDNAAVKPKRSILVVSDIYTACMKLPENKMRIAVLSATTGQPVAGAKIEVWFSNRKSTVLTADAKGEAILGGRSYDVSMMRAYTDTDNYMQKTNAYSHFSSYGNKNKYSNTKVFTDRAIYRPGQTVHASAVAFDIDGLHSTKTVGGKQMTFSLRDANNKEIEEKTATTDEYGTAAVEFTLPEGGKLNGRFSIRCSGNGTGFAPFRVEEYKRPTFEVNIDEVATEYHNGDTVKVTGKAMTYSGVPVQGAKVAYSVKRSESRFFWRYFSGANDDKEMLCDTVATDDEGRFEMLVPVIMPDGYAEDKKNVGRPWRAFYTFTASAQITDNAGESHDAETSLTLGTNPTALTFDMPEKALKDSVLTVSFKRYNASAKEIEGEVEYWFDKQSARYTAKANRNVTIDWSRLQDIKSGRHTLWAVCGTDTVKSDFVLFGIGDKQPAADTPDWAYVSSATFPRDGRPVYVQVGSSCRDTHIIYNVIAGNKVLESGAYEVSDGIVTTPYIYKEEYGEGILLNYLWVKDGQTYTHRYTIARPMQDKTLELKWVTFRDKLTPGQKETWTLNISRPDTKDIINKKYLDGEEKGSQLLALMYDKSLDQIVKNRFTFSLDLWQNLPSARWNTMSQNRLLYQSGKDIKWFGAKPLALSCFDYSLAESERLFSSNVYVTGSKPLYIRGNSMVLKAKEESATSNMKMDKVAVKKDSEIEEDPAAGEPLQKEEKDETTIQLRENLNETAFFYPALYADKDGNVNISFTLPESVTTWKFMGFAHDRNMNYGMIESQCVASKKVMVMPNMPRFVRFGDKASIAARVANTTDKDITTTVMLKMIDPETDKAVYTKSQKLTVKANSTESVAFGFEPGQETSLLICRISAEGKDYSDGEQHYLPVLPNRERVMNTVPFTFLEKGKKEISMDSLFPKDAAEKKLTVEYTANPTWLMIQALPYMAETDEKNAMSQVAGYYANVLGRHIMKQSPVIKKVVDLWKNEKNDGSGTLMSALEKNLELKAIVLDETPWVMDADKETDQKRMLSAYFNESAMDYRINTFYDGLKKLQNEDGSWSWWQGMSGSASMTGQVVETLARLKVMTNDNKAAGMIDKAMKYLGNVVVKEYEMFRKAGKEGWTININDSHAIQYLYINALLGRQLPQAEKPAKEYLMTVLRKDRQRNIFAKARMAVVLNKDGRQQEAKEYVESIRQYTVAKADMGRYFDTPRAGYSWFDYRIPTQTAAIEAIKAVTPEDKATVDEMRLWLLQSKRTQAWDTPVNSVNAVYAFMDGNYRELDSRNAGGMTIAVDGKNQTLPKVSAGLGYSKTVYDINKQKNLTVTKQTDGTSWGAVYAQFSQKVENVADNASGIKVKREIIRNANGTAFSTGDRMTVRITITADRDYDFVQVADKRAACMEPVKQLSGYHWGYYCSPKDNATNYYFDRLSKGTHVVETEYYVDRSGSYTTGSCTVQCAYSPEFTGRTGAKTINVE